MENKENAGNSMPDLSVLGLNYIHNQQKSLNLSLLYPIFTIIIQVLNFIFMLNLARPPPNQNPHLLPPGAIPNPPPPPPNIDIITPVIIFIILAVIASIKIVMVIQIRTKALRYESYQKKNQSELLKSDSPQISLTGLFYELVGFMEWVQKLSLILYIICAIYVQWYIRYFLVLFGFMPGFMPSLYDLMFWLNLIDQIGLIFFLIPEIRRFRKWNGKLKKLRHFEERISKEFEQQ